MDNPNNKLFEGSENFEVNFSVTPYPNENKNLSIISVGGETSVDTVPVKGQHIKTKARIENLLSEDYTRITSEVYNPEGQVVDPKYAQAILITPTNNEGKYPHEKTYDEMNKARNDGLVSGTLDPEFIKKAEENGWKIEITSGV